MKKEIYFKLIVLFVIGLSFASCVEDQIDRTYTGPSVVEFKNAYLERQSILGSANLALIAPYIVTGENTSLNSLTVRELGVTYTDSILVQLVGPISNQDVELDFVVDESSTAVEGVSYTILDRGPEGKVVIPAGESKGYIVFDVANGLAPADPARVTIKFNLVGNDQVKPSENYKQFTYNIVNN